MERVDVLAVMEYSVTELADANRAAAAQSLCEAGVAVSELIEAARQANELLELVAMISPWDTPQKGSVGHNLRTALARITKETGHE